METLRLVDVADDGQLVLMSRDGRRFVLPVDAEVRAAVRRDRAQPAEDERSDRPGPREVQARIRAGADADEVAAATGLDVAYVRRFEGPVLAERRHVAELARALPVHRDPGARPTSLETAVLAALADAGRDTDRIRWDSRRVEGTRWEVEMFVAAPAPNGDEGDDDTGDGPRDDLRDDSREDGAGGGIGPLRATWRIDVATRALDEADETARRLTALDRRRLSPVRDRVFDIETSRSRRQQQASTEVAASATASILEALALQRGRRPQEARGDQGGSVAAFAPRREQAPPPDAPAAPGDLPDEDLAPHDLGDDPGGEAPALGGADRADRADETDGERAATDLVAGRTADLPLPDEDVGPEAPAIDPDLLGALDLDLPGPRPAAPRRNPAAAGPRTVSVPATPAPRSEPVPRPAVAAAETPAAAPDAAPRSEGAAARRSSRRRRAAVPSWDDIVFGARVDDE